MRKKTKSITLIAGRENNFYWSFTQRFDLDGNLHGFGDFRCIPVKEKQDWVNKRNKKRYHEDINFRDRIQFLNASSTLYRNSIKSMGICLFCEEIDWSILENSHIDKIKLPNFTITMCANCHRRLHFYLGRHWNYRTYRNVDDKSQKNFKNL